MSNISTIEWTDATWNFVTGCAKVSPGCDHCYAETFAERFRGVPGHPFEQGFDLKLWPERLSLPFTWKKPRKIFVNSMSDIFHKDVPDDLIIDAFKVMALTKQHIYQILTKRPSRLVNTNLLEKIQSAIGPWPSHIWYGVSIESQEYDWRLHYVHRAGAPIIFVSAEPLLGSMLLDLIGVKWLIAGAESGHGARPMNEDWVRSLRDQCQLQHVAFFYKQNALRGKKIPLPALDGKVWNEYPTIG